MENSIPLRRRHRDPLVHDGVRIDVHGCRGLQVGPDYIGIRILQVKLIDGEDQVVSRRDGNIVEAAIVFGLESAVIDRITRTRAGRQHDYTSAHK